MDIWANFFCAFLFSSFLDFLVCMYTGWRKVRMDGMKKGKKRTAAEPVVVHLAGIAFDVVMLRGTFGDFEGLGGDDKVGGVGAAGPLLAVGAVAEGCDAGLAGVFILDGGAHAGTFGHDGRFGGRVW